MDYVLTVLEQLNSLLITNKTNTFQNKKFVFQMKRARIDDDFNPVYPYDTPNAPTLPFITPPFTSSDGLQEKPPGVLSVNYKAPITAQNGALTLKLGTGLDVNQNGELTSDGGEVTPPLIRINKKLGLAYNEPLTLQNNKLTLAYTFPLSLRDNGLTLTYDNPLVVQDNKLKLAYATPLTLRDNKLALSYNVPLVVNDGTLSLQSARPLFTDSDSKLALATDAPLSTATGSLRLNSEAPLGIADATLRVLFKSPLYLQNDFLTVAIERPLAVTNAGHLTLQVSPPLQNTESALTLSTAAPITVANGVLTLSIAKPLMVTNNSLFLHFRAPLHLFNSDPELGVNCNPPITVTDNALALSLGQGLELLRDRLTLKLGKNLQFENQAVSVSLSTDAPLQYGNTLRLNIGTGLTLSANSPRQLTVDADTGKGLTWNNNKLAVNLGDGLQFNSQGQIIPVSPRIRSDTLWTTADPSPNCTVYQSFDCRLWLSLVKCGGMVQGTVAVKAEKGPLLNPTADFISIVIYFYNDGVRRTNYPTIGDDEGTLANSATWGYRQGESADTNVTNAVEFMPSHSMYPINRGDNIQSQMITYTCIQGSFDMPVPLRVTYNHALEGYSLKFTWRVVRNQTFNIPNCSFSYITEQ